MNGSPAHSALRLVVLVALAGVTAACEPTWNSRVPVTAGTGGSSASQRPATVTVVAGDTVYAIARRYNLSVRDLIDANRLEPPYQLNPGLVLRLPGGGADYVVQKGDTLLGLARRFKVDFNTLAATNNKTPPYVVRVGERLTLPGDRDAVGTAPPPPAASASSVAAAPAPVPAPQPAPVPSAPSQPGPASAAPPGRGNLVITSPHAGGGQGGATSAPPRETLANIPAPGQSAPPAASGQIPLQPPAPSSGAAQTASAPPPVDVAPPARSSGQFLWPVRGEVVAEFGPLPGKGQHNDGINIAVSRGTQVKAAENGVVVYVGNELKGFGNLLLIKHADGWMTAYAHTEQMKVRRGDRVRRGQVIATVGSSGNAAQPQLHFEIRRGTEAVNPLEYLQDRASALGWDGSDAFS